MPGGGAGNSSAERGTRRRGGGAVTGPPGAGGGPGSDFPGEGARVHGHPPHPLGDSRLRGREAAPGLRPQVGIAWGSLNKRRAPRPARPTTGPRRPRDGGPAPGARPESRRERRAAGAAGRPRQPLCPPRRPPCSPPLSPRTSGRPLPRGRTGGGRRPRCVRPR